MSTLQPKHSIVKTPLASGCPDYYGWNITTPRKTLTQSIFEPAFHAGRCQYPTVMINPVWARGATAILASKRLPWNGQAYWEITIKGESLGSSTQVGIASPQATLKINNYVNLLGTDHHSWAMDQMGNLQHNGVVIPYSKPWEERYGRTYYKEVTIGTLFDGCKGTLTYYINGVCLGQAFEGLTRELGDIFPAASTTRTNQRMSLHNLRRSYTNLQDRARSVLLANLEDGLVACACHHPCQEGIINQLPLPSVLKTYVAKGQLDNAQDEARITNFHFSHY